MFIAFEETAEELATNGPSLGFDLAAPGGGSETGRRLRPRRAERDRGDGGVRPRRTVHPARLRDRLDRAKRIVLDTLEVLFSGLSNPAILRTELRRLFRWLKEKGVTAIVTAERGENA